MEPVASSATLNAGRYVDVTYAPDPADPSRTPPPEKIFVREPPISQLEELLAIQGDVPAFVEKVCGKPPKWADTLTDKSLYELYDAGIALNDPRFDLWLKRQTKMVEKVTAQAKNASALRNLLPTPPSPSDSTPPASGGA